MTWWFDLTVKASPVEYGVNASFNLFILFICRIWCQCLEIPYGSTRATSYLVSYKALKICNKVEQGRGSININLLLYFRKTSNFRIIFSHVHFWFIEWKVLWHSYLYSFGWAYFHFLNRIFSFLKHFLFQGTTILWHDKQNKLMKINSSKHILEQGGKKRKKKKKEIIGNSYCIML